jgi:hypothetical protein
MRAPKTITLLSLAIVLFVVSEGLMSGYFPAPVAVIGANGQPGVHRDMAEYYRLNAPAFVLMGCSALIFGWWLVRAAKHVYGRVSNRE